MVRIAALLSVLAILLYFAAHFDPHEKEVYRGLSGQARIDRMFAARHFLDGMGFSLHPALNEPWLDELNGETEVVFIYVGSALNDSDRVARALAWIESGGHLILAPQSPRPGFQAAELLQGRFQVSEKKLTPDADKADSANNAALMKEGPGKEKSRRKESMEVHWGALSKPLNVARDTIARLQSGADLRVVASDRHGPIVLQHEIGAGRVTFVYKTSWFSNWAINKHDHAEFLYRLIAPSYQGGLIRFVVRGYAPDSILRLLWRHAPRAMLAFAAIVILFVACRVGRFGPLQPTPKPIERSLRDQLHAQVEFVRAQNAAADLANVLAADLEARVRIGLPGWERLESAQRIDYVSHRYQIESAIVREALGYGAARMSAHAEVVQRLRSIELLRRKV